MCCLLYLRRSSRGRYRSNYFLNHITAASLPDFTAFVELTHENETIAMLAELSSVNNKLSLPSGGSTVADRAADMDVSIDSGVYSQV